MKKSKRKQMLEKALQKLNLLVTDRSVSWDDNVYQPELKIKKTVRPERIYSFNEISQNIHKQINSK